MDIGGSQGQSEISSRDYSTISPSARSLLLMKGLTNIPYAREAAALLIHPEKYDAGAIRDQDAGFWARVVHFENRYWSIDQLLNGTGISNFLELSSGFSFRGLNMVKENKVHYIDTDLPEITGIKKSFLAVLQQDKSLGVLETLPLNALDEKQFDERVGHFPEGPVIILNEGLLMYLGIEEKKKLCSIIYSTLKKRGGYWITADIYIRKQINSDRIKAGEWEQQFFREHRIEENKFESFEKARLFFQEAGFLIDQEAERDHSKLSSLQQLVNTAGKEELEKMRNTGRIQASWRLKIA